MIVETKLPSEERRLRLARDRRLKAEAAGAERVKRIEDKVEADLAVLRTLPGAEEAEGRRVRKREAVRGKEFVYLHRIY